MPPYTLLFPDIFSLKHKKPSADKGFQYSGVPNNGFFTDKFPVIRELSGKEK
jgi:hypothetical protein